MRDAEAALAAALASAKDAKTLKEACGVFLALSPKIDDLQLVIPPAGFGRSFSEHRNGLSMELGVMLDQDCAADSEMSANTIRRGLERLRREFIKLQQLGAKP